MSDSYCGECRYYGEPLGTFYETHEFHRCHHEKSIFKACIATASGCAIYEKETRDYRLEDMRKEIEEINERRKRKSMLQLPT